MTTRELGDQQDIHLVIVADVDGEGDDCPVCDDATARVEANVYVDEVKNCCLRCVIPIVREHATAGHSITVEVAS